MIHNQNVIYITPVFNIKDGQLIDENNVSKKELRDTKEIRIIDENGDEGYSNLRLFSLYKDLVIFDKIKYKVLRMYSYSPVKQLNNNIKNGKKSKRV